MEEIPEITGPVNILQAIAEHLRDPDSGDTSNATRQAARRAFVHHAGPRVYLGRIPEGPSPPVAVAIRLVDGGEQYGVAGEIASAQPVVEFLVVGRDPDSKLVLTVADSIRLIFSGLATQYLGDLWLRSAHVERTNQIAPRLYGDGSDRWSHAVVLDLVFSVTQTVS